jgi:hypothetical protein
MRLFCFFPMVARRIPVPSEEIIRLSCSSDALPKVDLAMGYFPLTLRGSSGASLSRSLAQGNVSGFQPAISINR